MNESILVNSKGPVKERGESIKIVMWCSFTVLNGVTKPRCFTFWEIYCRMENNGDYEMYVLVLSLVFSIFLTFQRMVE